MQKLEIINVRLGEPSGQGKMRKLLRQIRPALGDAQIRLYRNGEFTGDWTIHVHHPRCSTGSHGKSLLGFCLVDLFQSIGLVRHTVWFPEPHEAGPS